MYRKFDIKDYLIEPAKFKKGGKVVSELWKELTGLPWSEAKKRGLTDGSYKKNIALLNELKSGNFTLDKKLDKKDESVHSALKDSNRKPVKKEPSNPILQVLQPKSRQLFLPSAEKMYNESFKDKVMRFRTSPKTYGKTETVYHKQPSTPVKPTPVKPTAVHKDKLLDSLKSKLQEGRGYISNLSDKITDKVNDAIYLLKSDDPINIVTSYLSRPDKEYSNEMGNIQVNNSKSKQQVSTDHKPLFETNITENNAVYGRINGKKSKYVNNLEKNNISGLTGIFKLDDINTFREIKRDETNDEKLRKSTGVLTQIKSRFVPNPIHKGNDLDGNIVLDTLTGKVNVDYSNKLTKKPHKIYAHLEPVDTGKSDYKIINGRPAVKVQKSGDIDGYEVLGFPGLGVGRDVFKDDKGDTRVYLDKGHGNSHTWVHTGGGVFISDGKNDYFVRGSAKQIFDVVNEIKKSGRNLKTFRADNGSYNVSNYSSKGFNKANISNVTKKHPDINSGTSLTFDATPFINNKNPHLPKR